MGICFVFMLKIECFVLPNFFMILFLFKTDNQYFGKFLPKD